MLCTDGDFAAENCCDKQVANGGMNLRSDWMRLAAPWQFCESCQTFTFLAS